jgi:anhydro-N-acetylmuramic acid kinase
MALGGQGAPLAPWLDYCMLSRPSESRLALNVGGIANLTLLPAGCGRDDVTAFDTGPGNCLIDAACRRLLDRPYDRDGEAAGAGSVDDGLIGTWLADSYFRREPPKSTGREYFTEGYADRLIDEGLARGLPAEDVLASITALTAASVTDAVERLVPSGRSAARVIVSGGGVHNRTLMRMLERRLPDQVVESSAAHGLDPDAKEALLCALLASEAIAGVPAGMPSVTGASRPAVLGKICQGGHADDSPR